MSTHEVHIELLLGRRVLDADGRSAGRIEEVVADRIDLDCVVREYHVGPDALLERLSIRAVRIFRGAHHGAYRVPWERLDLTDPRHPRLRGRRDELAQLEPGEHG
ncbi:MAG: hypothetical protein H0U85_07685 [Gemmatimonadales bacterium]|nr:hypothetical protein [Gemmatimonadales bacterium]